MNVQYLYEDNHQYIKNYLWVHYHPQNSPINDSLKEKTLSRHLQEILISIQAFELNLRKSMNFLHSYLEKIRILLLSVEEFKTIQTDHK